MAKALLVAALIALCFACVIAERTKWHQLKDYTFENYVAEFSKRYTSANERAERKMIFEANLENIKAHNEDTTKTWKEGVNHLTDRHEEEFRQLLGYRRTGAETTLRRKAPYVHSSISALPASVDWREKGVVTPVKDQGQCGSCWAFGTAETVESYNAMTTGHLSELSIQQILDCTPNTNQCGGTGGCGGGTPELAMERIIQMGGLSTEWTYPYVSHSGNNYPCHFDTTATPVTANITEFLKLPVNTYLPVVTALANVGPLIINIDASMWHNYESGVFNGCNQTNPDIDHVVQLVGYGTDNKHGDYWLVRNSWTPLWGEDGYIKLARSVDVQCGTDLNPSDGTGCKGGPPTQQVCGTCGILFDVSYPIIE